MVKGNEGKKLWLPAIARELLNSKMTGGFQTGALASVKGRLGVGNQCNPRPSTLPIFWRRGTRRSREIFLGRLRINPAEMEERN